jgi:hypothetical protein
MKIYSRGFTLPISALIIGITALGAGTVATSQVALPGSALYGIKTATEKVRINLAMTDNAKAKTLLSIAETKLNEIEELKSRNKSEDKILDAEARFEDNTNKARGILLKHATSSDGVKLSAKVTENESRNEEILNKLIKIAPASAVPHFQNALERSNNNRNSSK